MSSFFNITSDDFSKTLAWWEFSEQRRAYSSLFLSEASIIQARKEVEKSLEEAETTADVAKRIILSAQYQTKKESLETQEAVFQRVYALKLSTIETEASKKEEELNTTLERLKNSFKKSLADYLSPLHHTISFFFLFRLFIKDRLELYAKYHPYDDSFQKQSKDIIVQLCNLRCSSDNEKVQGAINSCMNFVQKLEAALVAADEEAKTDSIIWDFWKEIIQEPEFLDFKVLSFLDTAPFQISLEGIVDHYRLVCSQLLEDIPLVEGLVISLLDSCIQDLEIKEYFGCPINAESATPSPKKIKTNFLEQLSVIYTLSSQFVSKPQIDPAEILPFYIELEEALSAFPKLFPNMRYFLEVIETKSEKQREEVARKNNCKPDVEEKKLENLRKYQLIHQICDSFLNFLHYQSEAYIHVLKTSNIRAKNLPLVSLQKEDLSLSPKLQGSYSKTLNYSEVGKRIEQFRLLHRKKDTECSRHANLYLGYIQGLLNSHIELTDYQSFMLTSIILLESCYYALEQTAGDLSAEKLNFHGLVARYQSLKITDPLLEELNFVPHWVHYLYDQRASLQSITTIKNMKPPPLLEDLFACLENPQQQKAEQFFNQAVKYVKRTLDFIMKRYSISLDKEVKGEEDLLEEAKELIPTDPFLNLRQPIPQTVLPDEKIYLQQMNLTLNLLIQSLNLLNRTNNPSFFAELVQKSTELLYRYFKQSLMRLHLKNFHEKASKELSVVELYKKCIGSNKKINELFAQFGLSGRYPYTITASTNILHTLQKEAIALMETPSLDHGFTSAKGIRLNSNETRAKLRDAFQDALEILHTTLSSLL